MVWDRLSGIGGPGSGIWGSGVWDRGSDLWSGIGGLGSGGLGSGGLGSGTRKLRVGVGETVLRTWLLRIIVLPKARATFWPQFLGLNSAGPKDVFSREDSEILGPEVVELHQSLTPTRQNTT